MPSAGGLKSVLSVGVPVLVGYITVNAVTLAARKFFLDKFLSDKSPAIQAAADIAVRLFLGVPVAAIVGKSVVGGGKSNLVAAGAIGNVGLKVVGAIAANVPGMPDWAGSLLGDWNGGSGVYGYSGYGYGDYITAGQQPKGVGGYMTVGAGTNLPLPQIAGGGRGAF